MRAGFSPKPASTPESVTLQTWCRAMSEAEPETPIEQNRDPDPTPEEIAALAAEIRAGWSDDELQRRCRADWRDKPRERYTIPEVRIGE